MVNVTITLTENEIQSLNRVAAHKGIEVSELIKTSALLSVVKTESNDYRPENSTHNLNLSKALTLLMDEYGLV